MSMAVDVKSFRGRDRDGEADGDDESGGGGPPEDPGEEDSQDAAPYTMEL